MLKPSKKPNRSTNSTSADTEHSPVSSIDRAAKILVCLGKGINNITDISDYCGLSKSTVHRVLNTLKEPRLAIYDSIKHRYYLGPLITQLATNSEATHQYLILCAMDEMKHLSKVAGETITLHLMMGTQFIRLNSILSIHSLKLEDDADVEPLLPFGALQHMLLSQLSEKELKPVLKKIALWSARNNYPFDTEQLKEHLRQVRQEGYIISVGERIPGGVGISAAVNNYFCPVTLSILGPETRLKPNLSAITRELIESAQRLSGNLLENFGSTDAPTTS